MPYAKAAPSFRYGAPVTPTDTNSTANIRHARWLQNIGTSGSFVVAQNVADPPDLALQVAPVALTTVTVYLGQGQTIECGTSWYNIRNTGLGAGVSIVAYYE